MKNPCSTRTLSTAHGGRRLQGPKVTPGLAIFGIEIPFSSPSFFLGARGAEAGFGVNQIAHSVPPERGRHFGCYPNDELELRGAEGQGPQEEGAEQPPPTQQRLCDPLQELEGARGAGLKERGRRCCQEVP